MRLLLSALLLFPFPLRKAKSNLQAVALVFLIYISNEGFQVGKGLISHGSILFAGFHNLQVTVA